jgi:DNA-3-methyladenine glycosylase II
MSMQKIQAELANRDVALGQYLKGGPVCTLGKPLHDSHFAAIVFAIIAQQISAKAADTITLRLLATLQNEVTPASILRLGYDDLKAHGLNHGRTRTIYEFAQRCADGDLDFSYLEKATDADIVKELSKSWGIARWTSEMFLLFRLGRLDVWPSGDLGVRKGWAIIQNLETVPTALDIEAMADHLRPYRSVVAWHCWRATGENSAIW